MDPSLSWAPAAGRTAVLDERAPVAPAAPPLSYCPRRVLAYGVVEWTFRRIVHPEGFSFPVLVQTLGDGREVYYEIGRMPAGSFEAPAGTGVRVAVARIQGPVIAHFGEDQFESCASMEDATAVWRADRPDPFCPAMITGAAEFDAAFEGFACDRDGANCRLAVRLDDDQPVVIPAVAGLSDFETRRGTRVRVSWYKGQREELDRWGNPTGRRGVELLASDVESAAGLPPPPRPEHPLACGPTLFAAGTVEGSFRRLVCRKTGDCHLILAAAGRDMAFLVREGAVRDFTAEPGTRVKVDVERRQTPIKIDLGERCVMVDTAKAMTRIR